MNIPKIYLISRKATAEQVDKIKFILGITPLSAVVVADPRDVLNAQAFCNTSQTLAHPIALYADFDTPLTAVNEDGSLTPIEV